MFVEVFQMGCQGEGFVLPVGEAKEGADADSAEASGVGAFGAFKPPVEIFLRSGGMEGGVGFTVVSFLVDDQPLGSVGDELSVLMVFHGPDFDGDGRDERLDRIDAGLEVAFGDKFRVFSGDQ